MNEVKTHKILAHFNGKVLRPEKSMALKIGLKNTTITCMAHQSSKKGSDMNANRFFMDTAYVLALLNQN